MRHFLRLLWLCALPLAALVLVACGQQAEQPVGSSPTRQSIAETPTAQGTSAALSRPTAAAPTSHEAASPAPSSAEGAGQGQTPEGHYVLGSADAAVTLIDYSDFL